MRYCLSLVAFALILSGCIENQTTDDSTQRTLAPPPLGGEMATRASSDEISGDQSASAPEMADEMNEISEGSDRAQANPDSTAPTSDEAPSPPPPADVCFSLCERGLECGAPEYDCFEYCRTFPPRTITCLEEADDCDAIDECIEQLQRGQRRDAQSEARSSSEGRPEPPPVQDGADRGEERPLGPQGPSRGELCAGECDRHIMCILQECAPSTIYDGFYLGCLQDCRQGEINWEEVDVTFNGLCPEVVERIRERDSQIDESCDAAPDDACSRLCGDRVSPCGEANQSECEAECANWTEANLLCVQFAQGCDEINGCFGDPGGQELCEESCVRMQDCMEASCPPRLIPPNLTASCTAGCLNDPPTRREVLGFSSASCRQVREFVYMDSPGLRGVCEGNPNFRPSDEECRQVCAGDFGECYGIPEDFCVTGCSRFTRDQYDCILASRSDCEAIDVCIQSESP